MSAGTAGRAWLVLLVRMPAEPARHRMALWRELRRAGAVPLGQAAWAVPDLPAVQPLLVRVGALADAGSGTLLVLSARGHSAGDVARIERLYAEAREQEWSEFRADCEKYLAELEEEDQSLDRLRRWYRDLRARDLLTSPPASDAAIDLKRCEQRFDTYAEHVYTVLGADPQD